MTASDSTVAEEGTLQITTESDIVTARTTIRAVANDVGFGLTDTTRIVTAVSELARNVFVYADTGEMRWSIGSDDDRAWVEIIFDDEGPGISDLDQAMSEGFSTSEGMGYGLSGTKKLMDEFDIQTSSETGTTVTVRKFLR